MIGPAGLKGPSAAIARQRVTAMPWSTRSISTFRSPHLRIPGQRSQLKSAFSGSTPWRAASVVGPASIRFNSTSTDTTPASAPETVTNDQLPDFTDLSATEISQIPEKIGYLKELGLDYGWGPSAIIQYTIEHLHLWTGLPWWASIVGTGLLIRFALLKPTLDASDNTVKTQNIRGIISPMRDDMMRAARDNNQIEVQRKRAMISEINKEHGITPWKSFVPMIQMPLGYGCFRVVRGMTALPVPALANESVAWLTDLTVADPMYILPLTTSFMMYLTFKRGGEVGGMDFLNTSAGKMVGIGLPMMSFAFMAFMPSALQLYFVTTGAWALVQSYVINMPGFRKKLNMAIQMRPSTPDTPNLPSTESKGLRLLYARIEAEKVRAAQEAQKAQQSPGAQNASFIDRWVDSAKGYSRKVGTETRDKLRDFSGNGPVKNADGSFAPAPRLSEANRKYAEEYELKHKGEEELAREERNRARREAYQNTLRAEREKAKAGLQRQQQEAKSVKARRKGGRR